MKPSRSRLLALAVALGACSDGHELPTALAPLMSVPPTANSACNVHWASGVNGSWFDATKWNPAVVPGSSSSVCIDAAGTYTVTMDPANDATPVDILALDVGGAGATPTLRLGGTDVTLNITEGIVMQQNATLVINNSAAGIINATGTITNSGTIDALAPCGGCGQGHAINADIINTSLGTLSVRTTLLTLGKVGGAYTNSGTITSGATSGAMVIPAAAGNASFSQDAGVITGASNFETFTVLSGTFTLNGGKARTRNGTSNLKPIVIIDGANLVIAPTATDSATVGVRASSSAATTITGNIPALTTLWLAGPQNLQPGTITFNDAAPVNHGGIRLGTIDGSQGVLTIAGSGRLTNADTMYANISGATDTFHFALEFTNSGKMHLLQHVSFEKPGGTYYNAGLIAGSGTVRMMATTLVSTATGTVSPLNNGAPHFVVDGGRLMGTGTVGRITLLNGGTVEPGLSAGILNAMNLTAPLGTALKIELGGTQVGTGYDQLNVALGASTLGSLDVSEINGFLSGLCGQGFEVLTWNSTHTGFTSYTGLNPAPSRTLRAFVTPATNPRKTILYGYDPTVKVSVAPNPVAIAEGGPGVQYGVCLDGVPALSAGQTVTVHAAPDAQVTVSPDSVKFTSSDWRAPKFFTVTAVDDNVVEGNHTGTIMHTATSNVAAYNGATISSLTANITDNDTNSPPVAANDNVTTAEDAVVDIDVLGNDSDPNGDPLNVSAVSAPAHGTATIQAGGMHVRYTPANNFFGPDAFTYTVSDGRGLTANASVAVTVTPAPDPPVAATDQASTVAPNAVVIGVLANDSDPDGDPLSVVAVTQPANGTAQISGGGQTATYTPNSGYSGSDTFSYTVDDGTGRTASASVSVSVAAPNNPPVANDDALSAGGGTSTKDVLANDSDPDGDALTVVSVTQPSVGSAAVASGGLLVTYTAPAGFTGQTDFTYTIADGRGGTATARVFVTVTNSNSPPAAVVDDVTLQAYGRNIRIPVLANDSDPDGDRLTIISVTTPTHGTAQISGGDIIYQADNGPYDGFDTFWYRISDGRGGEADGFVRVRLPYDLRLTSLQVTQHTPTGAGNWALYIVNGYALHYTSRPVPYDYIVELPPGTISAGEQLVWPSPSPDPVFTTNRCTVQNNARTGQPRTMRCTVDFHPASWPTPINYVSGMFAVRLGGPSNRRVKVTLVPSAPDSNTRNNALTTTISVP